MHNKTLNELAAGLKEKQFSSRELTEHFLGRIEQHDGALNSLGGPATLERTDIEGRPATQLSIGITEGVSVVTVLDRER